MSIDLNMRWQESQISQDGLSPEHVLLDTFKEELMKRFRLLGLTSKRLANITVQVLSGPEWIMAAVQGTESRKSFRDHLTRFMF